MGRGRCDGFRCASGGDPLSTWIDTGLSVSISGQILTGGNGLASVTMSLSGTISATTTTDANGNYSFIVPVGGTYTVTPSLAGYTFGPSSRTLSNVNANVTANFVVPTIALQNLTHPSLSPDFEVGDTFQIAIHGGANQPVSVSQAPGTTTQVGETDASEAFTKLVQFARDAVRYCPKDQERACELALGQ